MKIKFAISLILLILSNSLAGCISSDENELDRFPSFNLVDEQGNNHNETMYENDSLFLGSTKPFTFSNINALG